MRIYRALPLALVCLAGCGGPSLVGKWTMSGAAVPPGMSAVTEFKAKTYESQLDLSQGTITLHIVASGDYTFDGKKLTMTGRNVTIDDSKLPAIAKAGLAGFKDQISKSLNEPKTSDIELKDDSFTLTTPQGSVTFTKVK